MTIEHSDFSIGTEFKTEAGTWRCTDVGTRTVIAIQIDTVEAAGIIDGREVTRDLGRTEAELEGWFNGPPYAVAEHVFDEDDLPACEPVKAAPGEAS